MIAEIKTFLLAMTPVGELRASIPVALVSYHLNWLSVYLISIIGNLIPVVLLLLFLRPISNWLSRNFPIFQGFFSWLFQKTEKKYDSRMKKYGPLALATFVAIPLPMTGGWTGALIASLFGIPFKIAFPFIALGVIMAGVIVLFVTKAGFLVEQFFGWQTLGIIFLIIGVGYLIYKKRKKV